MNNSNSIHKTVIDVFAKHRQNHEDNYDEKSFKRFFVHPPCKKCFSERYSSRSRYLNFICEIQLHFGIYFSVKENETNHSLDNFEELIEQKLSKNKAGAIKSLQYAMGGPQNITQFIVLNAFAIFTIFVVFTTLSKLISIIAVTVALILNGLLASLQIRERSYNMKLMTRIKERE